MVTYIAVGRRRDWSDKELDATSEIVAPARGFRGRAVAISVFGASVVGRLNVPLPKMTHRENCKACCKLLTDLRR